MSRQRTFRAWLNPANHYDSGSVRVSIGGVEEMSISLDIMDCARKVSLSFNFGRHDDRKTPEASLKKLAILERALAMIRKELEDKIALRVQARKQKQTGGN